MEQPLSFHMGKRMLVACGEQLTPRRSAVWRTIAALALLPLFPHVASAQHLRQTTSFTCRDAAALVVSQGEVVLRTGTNTYERFVAGSCGMASEAPAWVATSDTSQCFIGYRCVSRSN